MIDLSEILKIDDMEHHLPPEELIDRCMKKAFFMLEKPERYFLSEQVPSVSKLTEMLVKIELDEYKKAKLLDKVVEYTDEIVSIEALDEQELMDITVAGNNTFYANGILTKNSHGLAMTVDILWAMIRTEELDEQNVVMFKQLKNRFSDMASKLRFVVGIDRSKMRLFDAETEVQMSKTRPVSNGSPKRKDEEIDQETGEIKFKKPALGGNKPRFSGIKVE